MLRLPDADQGLEGEVAALVRLTGPGPYDPAVVRQGLASRDVTLLRAAIRAHIDGGGDIIGSVEVDQSAYEYLKDFDSLAKRNAQAVFEEMEWE